MTRYLLPSQISQLAALPPPGGVNAHLITKIVGFRNEAFQDMAVHRSYRVGHLALRAALFVPPNFNAALLRTVSLKAGGY